MLSLSLSGRVDQRGTFDRGGGHLTVHQVKHCSNYMNVNRT